MTEITSRPSTRADLLAFAGMDPPHTVRSTTWLVDGEIAGVAGYYLLGSRAVVFNQMTEVSAPKIRIWREAKSFMRRLSLPALCEATPGSEDFLARLGWRDEGEGVFSWN